MAKKSSMQKPVVNYEALLWNTPTDKCFFCTDGSKFNNLEELSLALESMANEAFSFHVNSTKNDFASWIYDVIGDVELADSLRKTIDRKKSSSLVKKRVVEIKKKLKLS